ncbi:MAG TPA: hypothetical protein VK590_15425 [Saprospiraceae bacterium]|nr:hypothetical protein [Saprospiraceae bacterium]
MRSIYIILLLFPLFKGIVVPKDISIGKEPKQDFVSYYHYINLSNRSIYNGDLANAALFLDSAFQYIKSPYFKDLQKRIILNWKLNMSEKNIQLLNFILKTKHIDTAQLKTLFPLELLTGFNTKVKPGKLSSQMKEFKYQLERIYQTDQEIKGYYDFKTIQTDNYIPKAKREKQEMLELANADKFIKLIRKYGFPTENNIGYFIHDLSDPTKIKAIELSHVVDILFRNYLGTKFKEDALRILETAMTNHIIHPINYAHLKDHYNENIKSRKFNWGIQYLVPSVIRIDNAFYRPFVYYSKGLLDSVNNNRISIGLDSLHIEQHQIVSQQICGDSTKANNLSIPTYTYINEYRLGFVKWAVEKEGRLMSDFIISTDKIKKECKCKALLY